jgi:hypothetical protein
MPAIRKHDPTLHCGNEPIGFHATSFLDTLTNGEDFEAGSMRHRAD